MRGTNQLTGELWAIKRMVEEEPQGRDNAVHGRRRYARFLLLDLEPADIFSGRGMGRAPQPGCEPPYVTQIVALRLVAEPAHGHVVDQPLAQRTDRTSRNKLVHRSTPHLEGAERVCPSGVSLNPGAALASLT